MARSPYLLLCALGVVWVVLAVGSLAAVIASGFDPQQHPASDGPTRALLVILVAPGDVLSGSSARCDYGWPSRAPGGWRRSGRS